VRNAFVVSSLNKEATRNEAAANTTIDSNNSNPAPKGIRFKPYDKKQLEKILTSIDRVKVGANVVEQHL
jgi:Cdc6-like AAA superfamily ATPase